MCCTCVVYGENGGSKVALRSGLLHCLLYVGIRAIVRHCCVGGMAFSCDDFRKSFLLLLLLVCMCVFGRPHHHGPSGASSGASPACQAASATVHDLS